MIYFVTAREVGRVKIGYSCDPAHRFGNLRSSCPVTIELERVCEGTLDDETELHKRFAAHCVHGEWYDLTDEIEALMATLEPGPQLKAPKAGRRKKAFLPHLRKAA